MTTTVDMIGGGHFVGHLGYRMRLIEAIHIRNLEEI